MGIPKMTVPQFSSDLSALVEALIRRATAEGFVLCGFLGHEDGRMLNFGNVKETGTELAELYRQTADIVERKYALGQVERREILRPS